MSTTQKTDDSADGGLRTTDSANPYEVLGWAISFCCSELDEGREPRTIEMPVIMRAFEKAFSPPNAEVCRPARQETQPKE